MNAWRGKHILLRALAPDDVPTMLRHAEDSEIERLDDVIHYPSSPEAAHERLRQPRHGDDVSLAIALPNGRLIGGLSIFRTDPRSGVARIGLGIAEREYWGRGFGPDAVCVALRHLFHELRYHKVQAGVYAFNERSIRMFRRLGFVEEGRLRECHFTAGRYWDELLFGMTAAEFDAAHSDYRLE